MGSSPIGRTTPATTFRDPPAIGRFGVPLGYRSVRGAAPSAGAEALSQQAHGLGSPAGRTIRSARSRSVATRPDAVSHRSARDLQAGTGGRGLGVAQRIFGECAEDSMVGPARGPPISTSCSASSRGDASSRDEVLQLSDGDLAHGFLPSSRSRRLPWWSEARAEPTSRSPLRRARAACSSSLSLVARAECTVCPIPRRRAASCLPRHSCCHVARASPAVGLASNHRVR
jgi:hypothetical protein